MLLNVFINELYIGVECALRKFTDDTKLGKLWTPSRIERPYRDVWIGYRAVQSPADRNLTGASARNSEEVQLECQEKTFHWEDGWNRLPRTVVTVPSLSEFKKHLEYALSHTV